MRRRPHACFLLAAGLLLSSCSLAGAVRDTNDRPEALPPMAVRAAPRRTYEEALTLAFDRGYQILYSDERDRLIELEVLESRTFFNDRVRRLDLFVRVEDHQTRIHARVHSFDVESPGNVGVRDEDLEATRDFLDLLLIRLGETPRPSALSGGSR